MARNDSWEQTHHCREERPLHPSARTSDGDRRDQTSVESDAQVRRRFQIVSSFGFRSRPLKGEDESVPAFHHAVQPLTDTNILPALRDSPATVAFVANLSS